MDGKKIIEVVLNDNAFRYAQQIAKARTMAGKGRGDFLNCDRSPSGVFDNMSSIAECAVACATGFPWRAYDPRHVGRSVNWYPDVGPIEVKSVNSPYKRLLCQRKLPEAELAPYLLVVVQETTVSLVGWCFQFELTRQEYWNTSLPKPAFARPVESLFSLDSLKSWCAFYGFMWSSIEFPIIEKGFELK